MLVVRKSALTVADEDVFASLFAKYPYSFWLDSSRPDGEYARFSFMGGYSLEDARFVRCLDDLPHGMRVEGDELPFDFATGFVGYFGYEMKAALGAPCRHVASTPDCYLLAVDRFVGIDHAAREMYMVFRGSEADAAAWFDSLEIHAGCAVACEHAAIRFSFTLSEREYLDRIGECLKKIRDGESYQICLTNKLRATGVRMDPFEYYCALRRYNPAPYAAFLRFPELAVACSSPERFLKISRDGSVESKPVKGTCARSANPEEDAALIQRLRTDEKTRSENLMIVDLLRNDLGKVCTVGSVRVPKLMDIESYATVHQMVSTITGQLRSDQDAIDCIRACFPGGSMTGAPKLRAMEIIDSLETEARGVYSGSIGFLSANGVADLNIVIRTAVFRGDEITIGAGGGIVALSDPAEEWQEVLLKARAPMEAFTGLKR